MLAPILFDSYTIHIQDTSSRKFIYADDIASEHNEFEKKNETCLTDDLNKLHKCFERWRLVLNTQKTEVTNFT